MSDYDNDFDDLNKNWDNISNDSDNSRSYEAPPVKKLKVVTVIEMSNIGPAFCRVEKRRGYDAQPV